MERKDNDFEDYFTEDEVKEILATEIRGKPLFDEGTVDDVLKDYGSEIDDLELTRILNSMGDKIHSEVRTSVWKSYQAHKELLEEYKIRARKEKVDKVVDFFKDVRSEIDVCKHYFILRTKDVLQADNLPRKLILGIAILSTAFLAKYVYERLDIPPPQYVYGVGVVIESYRPPESFLGLFLSEQPRIKPKDYVEVMSRSVYLTEGSKL
ncbi:MAG: hypothetical protein QF362_01385 [Candidatus Woesearchaeota archaeon]|jgi:hypothetical protein|nr:hypothetical protein [Candidatus Woesearchaeota archaeon]MDP7506078.1 hypothetical protein [Candidatus Woesearchaeota archaeon]|tara:strand:- start:5643 stop:6269 length:627 start_codon:yes stop_codon:yes gene_type:complete